MDSAQTNLLRELLNGTAWYGECRGFARTLRRGTPHKLQMIFELLLGYVRSLTFDTVAEEATFILPLAATIFFFILFANWLDAYPRSIWEVAPRALVADKGDPAGCSDGGRAR